MRTAATLGRPSHVVSTVVRGGSAVRIAITKLLALGQGTKVGGTEPLPHAGKKSRRRESTQATPLLARASADSRREETWNSRTVKSDSRERGYCQCSASGLSPEPGS